MIPLKWLRGGSDALNDKLGAWKIWHSRESIYHFMILISNGQPHLILSEFSWMQWTSHLQYWNNLNYYTVHRESCFMWRLFYMACVNNGPGHTCSHIQIVTKSLSANKKWQNSISVSTDQHALCSTGRFLIKPHSLLLILMIITQFAGACVCESVTESHINLL